jgi:hypothetical protein
VGPIICCGQPGGGSATELKPGERRILEHGDAPSLHHQAKTTPKALACERRKLGTEAAYRSALPPTPVWLRSTLGNLYVPSRTCCVGT